MVEIFVNFFFSLGALIFYSAICGSLIGIVAELVFRVAAMIARGFWAPACCFIIEPIEEKLIGKFRSQFLRLHPDYPRYRQGNPEIMRIWDAYHSAENKFYRPRKKIARYAGVLVAATLYAVIGLSLYVFSGGPSVWMIGTAIQLFLSEVFSSFELVAIFIGAIIGWAGIHILVSGLIQSPGGSAMDHVNE